MHLPTVKPELLFNLGPIPVTNSILTSFISVVVLLIVGLLVGKNFKRLPSGIQHLFEMAYEMFENLATDALGKDGLKFVPLLVTFFLYIVASNWVGVLPGIGSIGINRVEQSVEHTATEGTEQAAGETEASAATAEGEHEAEFIPLFRGGSADLNTTFALALIAQVFIHVTGIRSSGLKTHLSHFKNPLEIISELSKVLSFGFRLFGNIFAGEVLLAAMAGIITIVSGSANVLYGIPGGVFQTPFVLFELFVGFIQAFVFAVLTLSFLSLYYKSGHH